MLINEDCLRAFSNMESASVDLAYLDPPFGTQKRQTLRNAQGRKYAFSDVWASREAYLSFMKARLLEVRRLLKDTGSVFLHCDSRASHHLRLVLDSVFGEENFRSEIIWSYKRWSSSKKGLLAGHQTIFFYSKTANFKFNTLYGEYSPTTNLDQILQARSRNGDGKSCYRKDAAGNVVLGGEKRGVPMSDVWEIPFLNPKARERTGYPTQKPVELLERILKLATDEGDLVLDPFCGSGTALVAASLLGRRHVGIDVNPAAIALCEQRLIAPARTESALLKTGSAAYLTKSEQELAILRQFGCDIVQRNRGIDAILKRHCLGKPVAIRLQKPDESAAEAMQLLVSAGVKKGCSFLVLVLQDNAEAAELADAPANMIVLNSYGRELQRRLDALMNGPLPDGGK